MNVLIREREGNVGGLGVGSMSIAIKAAAVVEWAWDTAKPPILSSMHWKKYNVKYNCNSQSASIFKH